MSTIPQINNGTTRTISTKLISIFELIFNGKPVEGYTHYRSTLYINTQINIYLKMYMYVDECI